MTKLFSVNWLHLYDISAAIRHQSSADGPRKHSREVNYLQSIKWFIVRFHLISTGTLPQVRPCMVLRKFRSDSSYRINTTIYKAEAESSILITHQSQ